MTDLQKINHLYKLKEVERRGKVNGRYETAAEHMWGTFALAEYFLPKHGLDELKVFKILIYHELVEIEAGDTFILDVEKMKDKKEREEKAAEVIMEKIPAEMATKFKEYWSEYEEMQTEEAKFCKAIDQLDPMIHSLNKKEDWIENNFTEEKLRELKEHYFEDFPILKEFFEEILAHLNSIGAL